MHEVLGYDLTAKSVCIYLKLIYNTLLANACVCRQGGGERVVSSPSVTLPYSLTLFAVCLINAVVKYVTLHLDTRHSPRLTHTHTHKHPRACKEKDTNSRTPGDEVSFLRIEQPIVPRASALYVCKSPELFWQSDRHPGTTHPRISPHPTFL